MALQQAMSQRWSLDFVSDVLARGRRFHVLAVVGERRDGRAPAPTAPA
jgi:putative transposase